MWSLMARLTLCVGVGSCALFSYLESQNEVTHLKIALPAIEKEIHLAREEIRRLGYEIDQFEHPNHLIELAHQPEFSHLKHPLLREIFTVPEAIAAK